MNIASWAIFRRSARLAGLLAITCVASPVWSHAAETMDSPGGRIIYRNDKGLVSTSPSGSHKKLLVKSGLLFNGQTALSPNGKKVAFLEWVESANHWTLRATNLRTGKTTTLVPPPVYPFAVANEFGPRPGIWSNDSSRIALNRSSNGFWVVDANGTNLTRLLKYPTGHYSWSQNDSKIAFYHEQRKGARVAYYDLRRDKVHQLGRGFQPRFSPTANLIALNETYRRVNVVTLKGKRVLRGPKSADSVSAEWVPDGTGLIATHKTDEGISQVLFLPVDGTEPEIVVTLEEDESLYPSILFSPNGKKVTFGTNRCSKQVCGYAEGKDSIFTAGLHGESPVRQLTSSAPMLIRAWSPNSRALLVCKEKGLRYFYKGEMEPTKGVRMCDAVWARKG